MNDRNNLSAVPALLLVAALALSTGNAAAKDAQSVAGTHTSVASARFGDSVDTSPTSEARQALAPTGKLRVGLQLGSPHNVIRDSEAAEMKGVGYDLGKELARLIGVPFEPVLYSSVGALLEAGKSGAWDVAFVGYSPARAKEWDFTALHMEIEFGYLVPGDSSISTMADVDRSGIRVAVQEKSQPDIFVSRTVKNAAVVRAPSLAGTLEMQSPSRQT